MSDIICISSSEDDEDVPAKHSKQSEKKDVKEDLNFSLKRKSSSSFNMSKEKRHKSLEEKSSPNDKTKSDEKDKSLNSENETSDDTDFLSKPGTSKQLPQVKSSVKINTPIKSRFTSPPSASSQSNTTKKVIKPILVVREKVPIPDPSDDIFERFLKACTKRKDDKDVKKILKSLEKRFNRLQPPDRDSEEFRLFLNKSLQKVLDNSFRFYDVLAEVKYEIVRRIKTPASADNEQAGNEAIEENADEVEIFLEENDIKKVQKLEKTIEKCKKKIKQLESQEVDFDDEDDSCYMQEDKYKRKLIELYAMLDKIIGDRKIKRAIYRKRLNRSDITDEMTGITSVDEAIINMINSGIKKVNQLKHIKKSNSIADYLTMPDYQDILQCISKCNEDRDLELSKKKMEQLARNAFKAVGKYLKKQRIIESNQYIQSYAEGESDGDPASKNAELYERLQENKTIGDKKLEEIFKKYVDVQEGLLPEDLTDQSTDENTTTESEDEVDDYKKNKQKNKKKRIIKSDEEDELVDHKKIKQKDKKKQIMKSDEEDELVDHKKIKQKDKKKQIIKSDEEDELVDHKEIKQKNKKKQIIESDEEDELVDHKEIKQKDKKGQGSKSDENNKVEDLNKNKQTNKRKERLDSDEEDNEYNGAIKKDFKKSTQLDQEKDKNNTKEDKLNKKQDNLEYKLNQELDKDKNKSNSSKKSQNISDKNELNKIISELKNIDEKKNTDETNQMSTVSSISNSAPVNAFKIVSEICGIENNSEKNKSSSNAMEVDEIEILSDSDSSLNIEPKNITARKITEDVISLLNDEVFSENNSMEVEDVDPLSIKVDVSNNSDNIDNNAISQSKKSCTIPRIDTKILDNLKAKETRKTLNHDTNIDSKVVTSNNNESNVKKISDFNVTGNKSTNNTAVDEDAIKNNQVVKNSLVTEKTSKNLTSEVSSSCSADTTEVSTTKAIDENFTDNSVIEIFEDVEVPKVSNEAVKEPKAEPRKKSNNSVIEDELKSQTSSASFIKVCSFAKPPEHWKDSPEKMKQSLGIPLKDALQGMPDPECVDLTNEKDSGWISSSTRILNPLAINKRRPVNNMVVVKNIINNYNVSLPTDGATETKRISNKVRVANPQIEKQITNTVSTSIVRRPFVERRNDKGINKPSFIK